MLFFNNEHIKVTGNHFEYIGVTRDEVTWTNVAAFVGNNSKYLTIERNHFEATGGTAILIRAADKPLIGLKIQGNTLVNCGFGAIYAEVASFASSNSYLSDVSISDNIVMGYMCRPLGDNHDAISVGTQTTLYPASGINITDNVINFLSPAETWNATTNVVSGGVNTLKANSATVGAASGIQVYGKDASTPVTDVVISGNNIRHAPQRGITTAFGVNITTTNNKMRRCGFNRDGSNVPFSSAHGIFSSVCALHSITGNTIHEQNPGCDGTASVRTIPIYSTDDYMTQIVDNTINGNDTAVDTSAWNLAAIGVASTAANTTMTGFTTRQCRTIVSRNQVYGTFFGLRPADGTHVRLLSSFGLLTVKDDDFICVTTALTMTVEKGVTTVLAARTSGTQEITLPDPTYLTGTEVLVKHLGLGTGLVTILAAAGTFFPAAPTLADTGQFKTFRANGTVWQQVA